MEHWKDILQQSVTTLSELKKHLNCDDNALSKVITTFPMRINPYFLELIHNSGGEKSPLWPQAVPNIAELHDDTCIQDPLGEEHLSPVPNVVHKYPDRVLFLVSNQCAMYCRFCTRKRKVGTSRMTITPETLKQGYAYLQDNPQVREVLLSGGDPLLLEDEQLETILSKLKNISHIEVIRIGSRVPSTLPMRITPQLVNILRRFHPLYINTHFNHPLEITPESSKACRRLADGGIPLGNHTVLLRGINDDLKTIKLLLLGLLQIRVKPYYLFQADLTSGTNHFRTPTRQGLDIMRGLIGNISGLAIPTYAVDAPGGKGKIPLTPDYIIRSDKILTFKNFRDEICSYPEIDSDF